MKDDLKEMNESRPKLPAPTAQALAAAQAINQSMDRCLRAIGIDPGPLTGKSHQMTALLIDSETNLPLLLDALRQVRNILDTHAQFWTQLQAHATAGDNSKEVAGKMVELCKVGQLIIDNATQ